MNLLYIASVIIVLASLIFILKRFKKVEFVAHAKLLWRTWSVRLSVVSLVIQTFPDRILDAWNILPPDVKSMLPPNWLHYSSMTLVVMAVFSQLIRQNKLVAPNDVPPQ